MTAQARPLRALASSEKREPGRPAVAGKAREVTVRFRCTEDERERIQAQAAKAGQSVSDYLRTRALTP